MKTLITLLALLFSTASAQITLEHELVDSNEFFTLIQIDSGEYCYKMELYGDSEHVDIKLFDLDYKLMKVIDIPIPLTGTHEVVTYITRKLFDLDDSIEYLVYRLGESGFDAQRHSIRIFKESGTVVFSCDSCSLAYDYKYVYEWERGIYNTPKGTKMLVMKHIYLGKPLLPINRIYSLPGKLPGSTSSNTTSAVEDIAYIKSALDIQAVPNPASDRVEINYHLPPGMLSGYIAIRDTKGAELQTHALNNSEGSISLDVRDLSPGSYYCCLLTSDGRTTVKKMMVVR